MCFNVLYLQLFIMHKLYFYLRILEFADIKGGWVMLMGYDGCVEDQFVSCS